MAVDFGILAQTPTIGARYAEGLQAAQAERDRNMLRQQQAAQIAMQQENMLAQRQEREAQARLRGQQELEIKTRMERAARNEKLLTGLGNLLRQNGYKMDRPTLGYMAEVSMQTGDEAGARLAMQGLQALDERDALQAALGPQAPAAAPAAAPSIMRPAPAATAPAAPTNMFAGTLADIGTTQLAPVNALAAPPQTPAAPAAGGMSRDQLQAIILNPSAPKAAVERAKAVLESLPKDAQRTTRTIDVGPEILTEEYDPASGNVRIISRQKKALSPAEAATEVREAKRIGLETRRVVVAEENARRDADPVFQRSMAAARATGEAIAKGDVAAQRALPQVISRAEVGLRLIDDLVGKVEVKDAKGKVVQAGTKPHPGFQDAVGATWKPGLRFVPGTDAADFMARFDQIQGQSFLEAFETLKGGGAITEKEGAKATEAINRARIAQSEREFVTAMRDLQDVVRTGIENAKRKSGAGAAPTGARPSLDSIFQ